MDNEKLGQFPLKKKNKEYFYLCLLLIISHHCDSEELPLDNAGNYFM